MTSQTVKLSALCLFLMLSVSLGWAQQSGVFYDDQAKAGETSICAYASVALYDMPGRGSRQVATALYTEQFVHAGREAFVRAETRNYILVRTADGKECWVAENFIIRNGGVVVLLQDSRLYEKPNTPAAAGDNYFRAGDVLILSDFSENWVFLTGIKKEKTGWIEGYDKLSVESGDIEVASIYARAMGQADPNLRRTELNKLRNSRSSMSRDMIALIDRSINDTYPAGSTGSTTRPRPTASSGSGTSTARPSAQTPYYSSGEDQFSQPGAKLPASPTYSNSESVNSFNEREVVDMETGQSYLRVTETGTIQAVTAKKPASIYYAYHKTLPIGSKVLLEVPGGKGFVQLEIVARLRSDNPNMIGLGAEVIKSVYGETSAKSVPYASITYPKP